MIKVYPVYKLPKEKIGAIVDFCIETTPDTIFESILNFMRDYYPEIYREINGLFSYRYEKFETFQEELEAKPKIICELSLVDLLILLSSKKDEDLLFVDFSYGLVEWGDGYNDFNDWDDEEEYVATDVYYRQHTKGSHQSRRHQNKHKHLIQLS